MTKGIQTYFNISGAGVGDALRHLNEQGGVNSWFRPLWEENNEAREAAKDSGVEDLAAPLPEAGSRCDGLGRQGRRDYYA